MSNISVPYLVKKRGRGEIPRYYWQPWTELRALGWKPRRVPANHADLAHDLRALESAAIAEARRLNDAVASWRAGTAGAIASDTSRPTTGPRARVPKPGDVNSMILGYKASRQYKDLAESTKRAYKQNIEVIARWAGDEPARAVMTADLEILYAKMRVKTPARANDVVGMARIIWQWGMIDRAHVDRNIAVDMNLQGAAPCGVIWPGAAITMFVAHADALGYSSVGDAILFNHWLGQREGDILTMKPPRLDAAGLVIRQSKTGAGVVLPIAIVPPLAARLEDARRRWLELPVVKLDAGRMPFIRDERTGEGYTGHAFRKRYSAVRTSVALECPDFAIDYIVAGTPEAEEENPRIKTKDLQFMHLRHTAVVRNAEAEVSIAGIASITGHSLKGVDAILERYLVRTTRLAANAFGKRLAHEAKNG